MNDVILICLNFLPTFPTNFPLIFLFHIFFSFFFIIIIFNLKLLEYYFVPVLKFENLRFRRIIICLFQTFKSFFALLSAEEPISALPEIAFPSLNYS